jgi:hypothetical protein
MLLPALTEIVPPASTPRLDSEVPVVSGTVPVPVAGAPVELGVEDDPVEAVDEDVDADVDVVPDRTCCTSAEIWLFTRSSAVLLAMLARPLA